MNQKSSKKSQFISRAVSLLFITSYFSFAIIPQIVLGQPRQESTPTDTTTPSNQITPDTTTP
ncbi:hypothetical protein, partial [uncultured Nostoc sp.]|uniref:hypothetical protein n=1 Tax=uncultured Nostoc sp. TaxID=340711 RepID=UPI0035C96094